MRLKNEIASLKKDHLTSPQHVIPIRRQILPAPPSKPSQQKMIQENNNNQMNSKKLKTATILNGGSKQAKSKTFSNLFKKLWKRSQVTKNNFKGSLRKR